MMLKRGQITIFVIIAILIVATVVLIITVRKQITPGEISKNLEPVYQNFLDCIEQDTRNGIDILGTQGGYIYLPDFEQGSSYMPLSSQLDFFGNPVQYWSYVSGNNIMREKVPSKNDMEKDLEKYISESITDCDFQAYYDQSYQIDINSEDIKADVLINDNNVGVDLNAGLSISDQENAVFIENHNINLNSKLGKFYNTARKIYDKEKNEMFLENYGIDVLRFYAPVDGVEVSCAPLTWSTDNIINDLQNAIESNTLALKTKGNYYSLNDKNNKYFIVDVSTDENIQFLNSKNWPYKIEINPADGNLLIAKPVGNQPGVGIIGFCYVPYHFVYDVIYPVLIQVYNEDEIFQFPIAVVIKGNKPREAIKEAEAVDISLTELCNYKNTKVSVNVYDSSLNPVDADISFECFGTRCDIGQTSQGHLEANFPQCVNGFVRARSDGYLDSKIQVSTNLEAEIDLLLDKKYSLDVVLKRNGVVSNENAIVSFVSDKLSETISYPEGKTVSLSEGQYLISIYSYSSSSINLQEEIKEECIDIPSTGISGIFSTQRKCFEIKIPSQIISNALSGGGKQDYYAVESELKNSRTIEIDYTGFSNPNSIEDLQNNYESVELEDLQIIFK